MLIDAQKAQARVEVDGCTILFLGSTYPPNNVTFSNKAIDVILNDLSRENYNDVIISGSLENKSGELIIVEMKLL